MLTDRRMFYPIELGFENWFLVSQLLIYLIKSECVCFTCEHDVTSLLFFAEIS